MFVPDGQFYFVSKWTHNFSMSNSGLDIKSSSINSRVSTSTDTLVLAYRLTVLRMKTIRETREEKENKIQMNNIIILIIPITV